MTELNNFITDTLMVEKAAQIVETYAEWCSKSYRDINRRGRVYAVKSTDGILLDSLRRELERDEVQT